MDGQCTKIVIGRQHFAACHAHSLDFTTFVQQLVSGSPGKELSTFFLRILLQRTDKVLLGRPFEKTHARRVRNTVKHLGDVEDDLCRYLFRGNKLEGKCHRPEHLLQKPVTEPVLLCPFRKGQMILRRWILVFFQCKGNERFREGKHFTKLEVPVLHDSRHEMKRARQVPCIESEAVASCKRIGQPVVFPENGLIGIDLAHEIIQYVICPEKAVRAGLDPVSFFVLP